MLNRFGPALTCTAWLMAGAALAQPAAPPAAATAVAPLTVQAAAPPKTVEKQAKSFVQTHAAPTERLGQFARWNDPVCVQVLGLIPEQAAQVKGRTEEVAKAVGLKVLAAGCTANIEIAFADQPQKLIDGIAKGRDSILGYHNASETQTLKTITRPVQAWYKTATRGGGFNTAGMVFAQFSNAAGQSMTSGSYPGMTVEHETADTPSSTTPAGCGDSHFSSCLSSIFKNVLVVVDNTKVKGQPLGPVSDYVAMMALSQSRSLDGCAALASVIDLYAPAGCPGREAPDGLTPADAAYLTALYSVDLEAKKAAQQSDITDRMSRILVKANQGGR
jgi:hypothetical protein